MTEDRQSRRSRRKPLRTRHLDSFCQRSLGRAAAADAPPLADAEGFVGTGDMVELQTSGPN
jgi:hypothetical protein